MIPPKISKNFDFFSRLTKTSSQQKRQKLLREVSDQELESIVEVAHNICRGNFKLKPSQLKKIRPYACQIRKLANKRTKTSAKKVIYGSGFPLSALSALLVPIILSLKK
jgi:hypothetical protein